MSVARDHNVTSMLAGIVSEQNVLTDEYSVSLFAQDVYTKDMPAMAVVGQAIPMSWPTLLPASPRRARSDE